MSNYALCRTPLLFEMQTARRDEPDGPKNRAVSWTLSARRSIFTPLKVKVRKMPRIERDIPFKGKHPPAAPKPNPDPKAKIEVQHPDGSWHPISKSAPQFTGGAPFMNPGITVGRRSKRLMPIRQSVGVPLRDARKKNEEPFDLDALLQAMDDAKAKMTPEERRKQGLDD